MKKRNPRPERSAEPTARLTVELSPRGMDLRDLVTEVSLLAGAGAERPAMVGRIELGRVTLGSRRLEVRGTRVLAGRSDLEASVSVGREGGGKVTARVRSRRLDLDDLLRAAAAGSKSTGRRKGRARGREKGHEAGSGRPISLDIEAAEVLFRRRSFGALAARIEHESSTTLARTLSFDHAGGRFHGEAEVARPNGRLSWRGSGRAEFPDVDTLVQALGGSPGALSGRLSARFDLRSAPAASEVGGAGRRKARSPAEEILGSFVIDLADGRLKTVRLAASALIPELSRTVGEALRKRLGWEEEGIGFRGLRAEGNLAGGRIEVGRIELQGPGIQVELAGSVGLSGLEADLTGKATIGLPRLMRRLPRLGRTSGLVVPLRITGPLTRPALSAGRPVTEETEAIPRP